MELSTRDITIGCTSCAKSLVVAFSLFSLSILLYCTLILVFKKIVLCYTMVDHMVGNKYIYCIFHYENLSYFQMWIGDSPNGDYF